MARDSSAGEESPTEFRRRVGRYTAFVALHHTFDAIVLRVYDVGEADRFCILFTKERGRIAARASGVRRPTSRMGASLLPFQRISLEVSEGRTGFTITGARRAHAEPMRKPRETMDRFLMGTQVAELLLLLLHDGEPLPEIFEHTAHLFEDAKEHDLLMYTVRVLRLLGVLPHVGHASFKKLTSVEQLVIEAWANGEETKDNLSSTSRSKLNHLCVLLIADQTGRVPRTQEMTSI